MDLSRQVAHFNPSKFKHRVNVIGVGATGSWLTLLLAKLGIKNIHVYDFDVVEPHNICNQLYGEGHVGLAKVDALAGIVQALTGTTIQVHNEEVTGKTRLNGVTFILTDSMRSRKDIYKNAVKLKSGVPFFVETRMGKDFGMIYAIENSKVSQHEAYAPTLNYTDEEAETSFCGLPISIGYTACTIANMAVAQMVNWSNLEDDDIIDNEVTVMLGTPSIIAEQY